MKQEHEVSCTTPSNVRMQIRCDSCSGETQHRVLTVVRSFCEWEEGLNSADWTGKFKTVMCLGCETISFVKEVRSSEDWDHDAEGNVIFPPSIDRYPEHIERLPIDRSNFLPSKLISVYEETLGAYNRGLLLLGAIGVRGIIETVCQDRSAPGRSLFAQIDALIPMGLLTTEHAKILHALRSLGNIAAHEASPPPKPHLGLAIDVCEHLLQGVYLIPQQAKTTFGIQDPEDSAVTASAEA